MDKTNTKLIKSFYNTYYKMLTMCNTWISEFEKYNKILFRNDLKDILEKIVDELSILENKFLNSKVTETNFDYYIDEFNKMLTIIDVAASKSKVVKRGSCTNEFEYAYDDDEIDLTQFKN